jgi:NAD+ synthase
MSDRATRISGWLNDQAQQAGTLGFVFGLSGGVDSAVVARLCQMAAPGQVLGLLLPCHSDPRDEEDARLVVSTFNIPTATVDLGLPYDSLLQALRGSLTSLPTHVDVADIRQQLPDANLKPRLRMASLYFFANALNYLMAGTGNRSEVILGYFTKFGDGGVDLLPIGGLLKSEVRTLAFELGVPARIIEKPPSAGLWVDQTDEAEMGFSYTLLEDYVNHGRNAVPVGAAYRIEQLSTGSEHKRRLPLVGPV